MNFLVDEQLPPALADWIRAQGHEVLHVRDLGLASSPDATVGKAAAERSAVVLTKEEDFRHLRDRKSPPIPVIWIRVGNCTNRSLVGWLSPLWPQLIRQLESGDTLIEVSR